LRRLWKNNAAIVEALRACRPDLTTKKGVHFASVLERVFEVQLDKFTVGIPVSAIEMLAIDKSALAISAPRRVRDEEHLQMVATLPCLVCARAPSQAHHLRFAQLRALGRKVSDEWAVPLCNLHHRALHDAGNEETWWREQGIDARAEAERLWRERRTPAETAPRPLSASGGVEPPILDSGSAVETPAMVSANCAERRA